MERRQAFQFELLPKTQTNFVCVECGFSAPADWVGAINIKEAGLASLACSSSSHAANASCQEPTEGIVCASVPPVGIPSVHEGGGCQKRPQNAFSLLGTRNRALAPLG